MKRKLSLNDSAALTHYIHSEMKILKKNAGPLTNFEVYDFMQKKGASLDPAQRLMTKLGPSELTVFDYLAQTSASTQTRESISEFTEKAKEFNLAKAEVVNIINIRPIDAVEADPVKSEFQKACEKRSLNQSFGSHNMRTALA